MPQPTTFPTTTITNSPSSSNTPSQIPSPSPLTSIPTQSKSPTITSHPTKPEFYSPTLSPTTHLSPTSHPTFTAPTTDPTRSPTIHNIIPTSTLSPTISEQERLQNLAIAWSLFGTFVFLMFTSKYLSKLVFTLISSFPVGASIKTHLELPLTIGLGILFLYLANSFIPYSENFQWLNIAITYVIRFLGWCEIWFAAYSVLNLGIYSINASLKLQSVPTSVRYGIVEAMRIVEIVLLFFIGIVLIGTLPINYQRNSVTSALGLFSQVNLVTGTIIFAFAPALRDIISGLSMYFDKQFGERDLIQIWGVTTIAKVEEMRLRVSVLRLRDDSIVFVPNTKIVKFPSINFSVGPSGLSTISDNNNSLSMEQDNSTTNNNQDGGSTTLLVSNKNNTNMNNKNDHLSTIATLYFPITRDTPPEKIRLALEALEGEILNNTVSSTTTTAPLNNLYYGGLEQQNQLNLQRNNKYTSRAYLDRWYRIVLVIQLKSSIAVQFGDAYTAWEKTEIRLHVHEILSEIGIKLR
jgi:small-conductance mechanosensitive channel